MKKKDKNSKIKLADMLRYNSDNLSGSEKNSIEREFQKDPFAEEATEGFSSIEHDEAVADIHSLERSLSSRISRGKRVIWYRIAASVAILMAVGSAFLIFHNEKPVIDQLEIAYTSPIKSAEEKETDKSLQVQAVSPAQSPIISRKQTKPVRNSVAGSSQKSLVLGAAQNAEVVAERKDDKEVGAGEVKSVGAISVPQVSEKKTDEEIKASGSLAAAGSPSVARTLSGKVSGVETKEFRAESDTGNKVILNPGVMALDEVVTVAYGLSRDAAEADLYTPPEPEGGKKNFDTYLRESKVNPDSIPAEKRKIVVLKFIVTTEGRIQNIRITKTPGRVYSEEAKRLVLNGPSWKPAERNGVPVNDDVTLRISFK
jgi:hypothetical protein